MGNEVAARKDRVCCPRRAFALLQKPGVHARQSWQCGVFGELSPSSI